jgi:uncharacterized protein involved in exopolysaccharide biosynthesis
MSADTLDTLQSVWRNRRSVLVVGLAAAIGSAVLSLILPSRYTTTASFVADQGSDNSLSAPMLGLASTLGVRLPGASASPQFYAAVASSRRVFEAVAEHEGYPTKDGDRGRLADALNTEHEEPSVELERTVKRLRKLVRVSAEPRTGIVQIDVTASSPELAAGIGQRFLAVIDSFNVHIRRSRGGAEESFVGRRLAQAGDSLRAGEEALARFQIRNRTLTTPELALEQARLQRAVNHSQSIYLTLAQQYEQAKISARRDVPAITVIEQAKPPVKRSFPRRTLMVLGGTVIAAGIWILVLVSLSTWQQVYPRDRWPSWLARAVRP